MKFFRVLCLTLLSVACANAELKSCETFVYCKCESLSKIYKFCNNQSNPEDFCKRFPLCASIPYNDKTNSECPEGAKDTTCENGLKRKRRQISHNSNQRISRNEANGQNILKNNTECSDPGFISNAVRQTVNGSSSLTPRTFSKGEIVIFQCISEEFALQGTAFLRCTSDGSWSSVLPRCFSLSNAEITCPDPGYIANGNRLNTDGAVSRPTKWFEIGQSVLYVCNDGFSLQPHSLLTCTAEGMWSNGKPRCIRANPGPENVTVYGITRNKRQTFRNLFQRISGNETNGRNTLRSNAECPDPGFISNAVRQTMDGSTSSTPRSFKKGEVVIFACASEDFALQGTAFIRCASEGTWSSPLPRCIRLSSSEVTCPDPGHIANGNRQNIDGTISRTAQYFEIGQSVLYTCNEGFALQPHSLLTCTAEGIWSKGKPRCIRANPGPENAKVYEDIEETLAFCQDPGIDPNGDRTPRRPLLPRGFMQGTRLEYFCYEEYFLRGEEELFCLNTGKWSSEAPTCEDDIIDATSCYNPGNILNGEIKPKRIIDGKLEEIESDPQYPVGTRLEYSCHHNHVLEGTSFIVCGEFGTWSAQPPSCFPKCGVSYEDGIAALGDPQTYSPMVELNSVKEWPWSVMISRNKEENIICNAVLINSNTVLTASNCVSDLKTVFLYFGRMSKNINDENSDLIIRVSREIIRHPEAKGDREDENDIALIKFAPRVRFTEKVLPICLPTNKSTEENVKEGRVGYVAGLGWSVSVMKTPDVLLLGKLIVPPSSTCSNSYSEFCGIPIGARIWNYCMYNGAAFAFYDSENDSYTLEGILRQAVCVPNSASILTLFRMTKVQSILPWVYENIQK